jgi:drug/metabolite transporter (DMT)-like permease
MSPLEILLLVFYAAGMALGQLLFKTAATNTARDGFSVPALLTNVPLIAALALYAGLTLLWVYLLTTIPLSRAYPFLVLSFVFTPLLSAAIFGDALGPAYIAGLALIILGLLTILRA